mmetsp:Transcript_20761/g.58424  ORF Transcript_20761/g.58424 Transcript_20761/m.58424 type:complete len:200 (+) Transcript_20761:1476-2075(+)
MPEPGRARKPAAGSRTTPPEVAVRGRSRTHLACWSGSALARGRLPGGPRVRKRQPRRPRIRPRRSVSEQRSGLQQPRGPWRKPRPRRGASRPPRSRWPRRGSEPPGQACWAQPPGGARPTRRRPRRRRRRGTRRRARTARRSLKTAQAKRSKIPPRKTRVMLHQRTRNRRQSRRKRTMVMTITPTTIAEHVGHQGTCFR